MTNVSDIRDFLKRYHNDQSYAPLSTVPSEGDVPADMVRDAERATGQEPGEHVIPTSSYEYRLNTGDVATFNQMRIDENIHLIERYWDTLVDQYGLDSMVTYVPFHEDVNNYGIYISQRGVRFLGHLLFNWSKVLEPAATSVPMSPAGKPILDGTLIAGQRLRNEPSEFESLEDAFDLAYEILRRYGWFHHQTELFAAYLEDIRDDNCYSSYRQQCRQTRAPYINLSRGVGNLYVAHSRACQNAAPNELFQPLLKRTLREFDAPTNEISLNASDGYSHGRQEISKILRAGGNSTTVSTPIQLSNYFPFSTNVDRAIPHRVALYITRRESDADDGSFANQPGVISLSNQTTYAIEESSTYQKKYNKNPDLQNQLDNVVEDIRESFETQDWKGIADGPDDKRYIDVTGSDRLVVSVDKDKQSVELLDFGDRMKIPPKYGLHKSQN